MFFTFVVSIDWKNYPPMLSSWKGDLYPYAVLWRNALFGLVPEHKTVLQKIASRTIFFQMVEDEPSSYSYFSVSQKILPLELVLALLESAISCKAFKPTLI